MTIDLNRYSEFVYAVTSEDSKDLTEFMNRLDRLDANFEVFAPTAVAALVADVALPLNTDAYTVSNLALEDPKFVISGVPGNMFAPFNSNGILPEPHGSLTTK